MRIFKRSTAVLLILAAILFLLFSVLGSHEVPVLMYHFIGSRAEAIDHGLLVSNDTFKQQLEWLKRWGYHVYSLDELYDIKTERNRHYQKGVVLTFDDGSKSFLKEVVPLLNSEQIPAASFLIWNNVLKEEKGSMSLAEIKSLMQNPWVTFGVHTVHHKVLVNLSDEELEEEIVQSKRNFESVFQMPMLYFAYPGGYFDDLSLTKVREAGYHLAFTTARRRLEGQPETLHSLVRVKITEKDANEFLFWLKASGTYTLLKKWKWQVINHVPPTDYTTPLD